MSQKVDYLKEALKGIEIPDICMDCNRDGCKNYDGKSVPCLCEGHCKHDNECACNCHAWQQVIRWLEKRMRLMQEKQDRMKDAGDRVAQALLESRCDCPNYGLCECERSKALDEWARPGHG